MTSCTITAYVDRHAYELSERDLAVLKTLLRVRFATSRQIQRVHVYDGTPLGNTRVAARILKRLADQRIITRLPRQVGGVRAGSASMVLTLARPAIALLSRGTSPVRTPKLPGEQYIGHALAVTELYVGLKELEREDKLTVKSFQVEPRRDVGVYGRQLLRPDANVKTHIGQYAYYWFIEMDLGTERRPQLRQKLDAYTKYWARGREQHQTGVFPKVLFLVPDDSRKAVIDQLVQRLPIHHRRIFQVELIEHVMEVLSRV